jgi:hypothetical protein
MIGLDPATTIDARSTGANGEPHTSEIVVSP